MNPSNRMPNVALRAGEERRLRQGHPWAYSNEVQMTADAKAIAPGSLVQLRTAAGEPLGVASFNPHSLIAARLFARDPALRPDRGFMRDRLRSALALRQRLIGVPFYRLIHAEADGLPGLIIDRFDDVLTLQANTAGMDRLLPLILEVVAEELKPRTVVLKNDSPVRELEGLPRETGVALGSLDGVVELQENGARFVCDPAGGQKTGWFYDQRDNRAAVAALAEGMSVLDLYCYSGGFGVLAALRGAREVMAIDRSKPAIDHARHAADLNGVGDRITFHRRDVFELQAEFAADGRAFDIVIADPPAFVKSRKDLKAGAQGYRKMTRLAAALVKPGGLLFAASCSHHMDTAMFLEQVRRGLTDAHRQGRILRAAGAAADHPVHPSLPESAYLKSLLLQLD